MAPLLYSRGNFPDYNGQFFSESNLYRDLESVHHELSSVLSQQNQRIEAMQADIHNLQQLVQEQKNEISQLVANNQNTKTESVYEELSDLVLVEDFSVNGGV